MFNKISNAFSDAVRKGDFADVRAENTIRKVKLPNAKARAANEFAFQRVLKKYFPDRTSDENIRMAEKRYRTEKFKYLLDNVKRDLEDVSEGVRAYGEHIDRVDETHESMNKAINDILSGPPSKPKPAGMSLGKKLLLAGGLAAIPASAYAAYKYVNRDK